MIFFVNLCFEPIAGSFFQVSVHHFAVMNTNSKDGTCNGSKTIVNKENNKNFIEFIFSNINTMFSLYYFFTDVLY